MVQSIIDKLMWLKKLLAHKKRESPIIGDDQPKLKASAECGGMGERELQLRLELILDKLAAGEQTIYTAAKELAAYSLSEQTRFLQTIQAWQKQSPPMAYQLCRYGLPAFKQLKAQDWDKWLHYVQQNLHSHGRRAAIDKLRRFEDYLARSKIAPQAARLEELMPVLSGLLAALGGRPLRIQAGETIFTDTAMVYLPAHYELLPSHEDNYGFYKLAVVFAWAQTWFATWQVDLQALLYDLDDYEHGWSLFQALEGLRLDACIERSLPGIARLGCRLGRQRDQLPDHPLWQQARKQLEQAEATAHDSVAWIKKLAAAGPLSLPAYQGRFNPAAVRRVVNARVTKEEKQLQTALQDIVKQSSGAGRRQAAGQRQRFSVTMDRANPRSSKQITLGMDGEAVELTPQLEQLLRSIIQDWGEIPRQWLKLMQDENDKTTDEQQQAQLVAGQQPVLAQVQLPEWDHSIFDYRRQWCHVFLHAAESGQQELGKQFSQEVKDRHRGLINRLSRSFEFLRESEVRLRGQADGDDIDIDAVVASLIAMRCGEESSAEIYTRRHTVGRNVAVVFMVDMSGSTKGRVNQIEKEALILLCESLSALKDRYALYGFSSHTREKCMIYCIKSFDEEYDQTIQSRIAAMQPQHYTRMGAAIRYLRRYLLNSDAKTRLLLSLSDGRPEDKDGYRGNYGIEDTRRALLETACLGIHSHCITIDDKAMDYLPYMYGPSHVSVVNDLNSLPFRMADIYRRITQ